jgi:hypothetical protein
MAGKIKLIFGSLLRSLHQLWLEVVGSLFVVLSFAFGATAVKEYRKYTDSSLAGKKMWLLISVALMSVLTLAFGIHSFWKARKLR